MDLPPLKMNLRPNKKKELNYMSANDRFGTFIREKKLCLKNDKIEISSKFHYLISMNL